PKQKIRATNWLVGWLKLWSLKHGLEQTKVETKCFQRGAIGLKTFLCLAFLCECNNICHILSLLHHHHPLSPCLEKAPPIPRANMAQRAVGSSFQCKI
ncbi:hypothetical protein CUMW_140790, partial [Citrus unshiu]